MLGAVSEAEASEPAVLMPDADYLLYSMSVSLCKGAGLGGQRQHAWLRLASWAAPKHQQRRCTERLDGPLHAHETHACGDTLGAVSEASRSE
jgi:hypothetical protein